MQDVSEVGWPEPRLGRGARVLVTGAAGGLGANLVKALVETGYRVRAVDRVELADTHLARDPWIVEHAGAVEWVRADLQVGRLRGLVAGCDGVVHAAARVSLTEDYDAFVGPNVEVTRRLRQAARQAGVDHLVYVSCGTLYAPTGGVLDEDSPLELTTGYARSKREAEWAAQSQAGPAWTILRPGLLYGPYCRTMSAGVVTLPPILRQFISYVPGLTGGPRTNWCHVTDAARAACFVLGRPAAQGRVLNVADATPLGLGEVLTAMTEACGLELGPLLPFPTTMTRGVLTPLINHDVVFDTARTVLRQLWKRVQTTHQIRSPLRPRVDRKALHHTSGDAIVDASALRALGWVPRWEDLREGIVPTVQWYQARGWLPRYDTQAALELEQATQTRGFGFNEELTGQLELEGGACRSMTLDLDAAFGPHGPAVLSPAGAARRGRPDPGDRRPRAAPGYADGGLARRRADRLRVRLRGRRRAGLSILRAKGPRLGPTRSPRSSGSPASWWTRAGSGSGSPICALTPGRSWCRFWSACDSCCASASRRPHEPARPRRDRPDLAGAPGAVRRGDAGAVARLALAAAPAGAHSGAARAARGADRARAARLSGQRRALSRGHHPALRCADRPPATRAARSAARRSRSPASW